MIKFFILAPIFMTYDENSVEENLTVASSSKEVFFEKIIIDAGLKKLSDEILHYHSKEEETLSIINALSQERNLYPYYIEISNENISGKNLVGSLVVDKNLKFLVSMEIECTDYTDAGDFIYKILTNRDILKNLSLLEWSNQILIEAEKISLEIINKSMKAINLSTQVCVTFQKDAFYPLVITNEAMTIDMSMIFHNDENIGSRINSEICNDYNNSFLHIGWNYAISMGLNGGIINMKIISFLIYLQIYYYRMRFFKVYFLDNLENFIDKKELSSEDNEMFSKLKIAYHKFTLNFMNYKTGLNPKFYNEFDKIEKLWHINDDMMIIDNAFVIQNDRVDKLYMTTIEKDNGTQNLALKLIAVLQVFGIYSIYFDGYELLNKNSVFFLSASILAITMCLVVILLLWKSTLKNIYMKMVPFKRF